MVMAFAVFSLMLIPTMTFFNKGTSVDSANQLATQMQGYEVGMISNIGYSSVQCASIPAEVGELSLGCPYGTIGATDGKPLDFGVNIGQANARSCTTNDINKKCKPDNYNLLKQFSSLEGASDGSLSLSSSDLYENPQTKSDCLVDDAVFFVQFKCIQSQEQQNEKYEHLTFAVSVGSLICLLFTVGIRYLYQGGKI